MRAPRHPYMCEDATEALAVVAAMVRHSPVQVDRKRQNRPSIYIEASAMPNKVAPRRRVPSGHPILGPRVTPGHVSHSQKQSKPKEVTHCEAN